MSSYLSKASNPKQYDLGEVRWDQEGSGDNYFRRLFLESIDDFIGEVKNKTILDVGSGTGWLVSELNNRGAKVIGIDPSKTNLLTANARYPKLEFRLVPIEDFNYKKRFDIVICVMVFEHIPDLENAFEKINSLLKPDGRLIVITGDFNKFVKSRFGYTVEREIIEDEIVATKTNYGERMGVLYDINRTPNKYIETAISHDLKIKVYKPIQPTEWLIGEQEKYAQFSGNSIFHLYIFERS